MFKAFIYDIKLFLVFCTAALFLAVSDNFGFIDTPKKMLQIATVPVQYGIYKTGLSLGKQFEFFSSARYAVYENKILRERLASIISENSSLKKKIAEMGGMLQQQNYLNPTTFNLIPARPLGFVSSRYLLIDKGISDGLKNGESVVFKDNLLGLIVEASSKQARVLLLSDPDSKIGAFAANKNGKAKGVLIGQFGSEALLDKILHTEPLSTGDLVYSEGSENSMPRGLILGTINEIIDQPNEVFKQAKVKPLIEITNLDIVFVIGN